MTSWRSVRGHIDILDAYLTTPEIIEEFFADQKILGRGMPVENGYDFEVAISGRRRRVAMLDDAGTVIRGLSVTDLLVDMQEKLRKVAVELDGEAVHGPIDLGAVDVDDDLDIEPEQDIHDVDAGVSGAKLPDFDSGSMMLITDMSMSEVPPLANTQGAPIMVSKFGNLRVLVSEQPLNGYRKVFPRPNYMMALAASTSDHDRPMLAVRRDGIRMVWDWSGEMPLFAWIVQGSPAHDFVIDELGAGAVARLAIADLMNVTFAHMRRALLETPERAVYTFLATLGLPREIADVLTGRGSLSAVPAAHVVSPEDWTFAETLAWEFAGEGVVEPSIMRAVQKIYLDRPWLVAMGSVAQSAIAGALLATAYNRHRRGIGGTALAAVGAGVLMSAFTRIGTTTYMRNIVDRKQSTIESWRNMRNWEG